MIVPSIQENYNTPLEHTPGNPPGQLLNESHYSLLVKVAFRGVFQFGVLKQSENQGEPRKKPSYFPLYWLFNRDF